MTVTVLVHLLKFATLEAVCLAGLPKGTPFLLPPQGLSLLDSGWAGYLAPSL